MDGGIFELTLVEHRTKPQTKDQSNYTNHPEYISYVKLLKEYFEIKNDERKLQQKFTEITTKHQQLVKIGIIKL